MLIISLLIALIAGLLIVILMLWARLRKLEQTVTRPQANDEAAPPARHGPLVDLPAASPAEAYDPDATKVHIRPPLESAHAVLLQRAGAAPVSVSGAHLVGLTGSQRGRKYPIATSGITVGRHQSCDVVIPDTRVSAHHAWIGLVDGKPVLRDLESTNGTFLNTHTNESVSEAALVSGDTILFGSHQGDQFRFVVD
ncbi:MAG: FHA domain-containing protein [Rhodocyclaceae bacterium]|nr:FHA domain-containing protein [Rhodocyclaceae bacterium]